MASFEFPEMPKTPMSPQMLVGVASPLWAYFGAAAAGGVAYWWMTRWTRPMNVEALFGAAAKASPMAMLAAAEEVMGAAAEAAVEAAESMLEPAAGPVGGESAPMSPLAATIQTEAAPTETEGTPAPVAQHAMVREDIPSGAVKEAVSVATDETPEDAGAESKPKARKAATKADS